MLEGMNERQLYRFDIKIRKTEACWYWEGAKNDWGYGYWGINGELRPAHIVSYEIYVGKIEPRLELDHICRNVQCVNPFHLEPVTHQVNVQRAMEAKANSDRAKTHCIKGHPLSGGNLLLRANGKWRRCRICNNEHARAYWRRKHLAA